MNRIYLDYAATTPTDNRVISAMRPFYGQVFGNPSSFHSFGQEAKAALESSREKAAQLLNAHPEEIVFTSGGTESDNFALEGLAFQNKEKKNHIITSKIEHHAITHCCEFLANQGFEITYVPVDKYGVVDPEDVKNAITKNTLLISIMHANNEVGTIEPIEEIAKIAKQHDLYFHTDAVQTAGHLPIDVKKLGIDLLSISGHKFYGPKGVGALYIKKGTKLMPYLHGGGQERGRRASTENVPGIVGMGIAAEIAIEEMKSGWQKQVELRDMLIKGILDNIPESYLNGPPTQRLANNVNISIKHVEGESMLLNLDHLGIAASTGSACTSGSLSASHVLLAMGINHALAHGSLRFSLGRLTTEKDIEYVIEKLPGIVKKLRDISPLYKRSK